MSYRITKSALLYYLNKSALSISRKRFLDRKDKRLVIRGLFHEVDDRVGGSCSVSLCDPPSDEPDGVKLFRQQEQVFPSGTGLVYGNSREDTAVGKLSVERDFHVARTLEFLKDDFIHA